MRLGLLPAIFAAVSGYALRAPHKVPLLPASNTARGGRPVLVASQLEEVIQQTTTSNTVVIYSKSWCPYCAQCKALFDDMSQPYTAIELDEREDGELLQAALLRMTQQRTVPNVFVAGQHLGGNDDTQQAARSGKLAALLDESPTAEASTGRVLPTGDGSSATPAQRKAVTEFKMITETEATIRKVAGVGLGLATATLYSTSGLAYTTLSAGIFGALSVYRSGAAYQ
jgi:glutaredoxin 3